MKIILISNYTPDKQESMKRYADSLAGGLRDNGIETTIWYLNVYIAF